MPGRRNPGVGMDGAGGSGSGRKPQKNATKNVHEPFLSVKIPHKSGASESARILLPALARMIPALNAHMKGTYAKGAANLSISQAREVLSFLVEENTSVKQMAEDRDLEIKSYFSTFLYWAQKSCGVDLDNPANKLVPTVQGNFIHFNCMGSHGLFPENWQVPLSKSSLKRDNKQSLSSNLDPGQHRTPQKETQGKKPKKVKKIQQGEASKPALPASRKSRDEQQVEAVMAKVVDEVEASMEPESVRPAKARGQKKRKALQDEEEEEEEQEAPPARPTSAKGKGKKKAHEGKQQQQPLGRPQSVGDSEGSGLHSGKRQRRRNQEKDIINVGPAAAAAQANAVAADAAGPSAPRRTPSSTRGPSSNFNTNVAVVSKADCYWLNRTGVYEQLVRGPDASKLARNNETITSCHDCQGKHIQHMCNSCGKSYCQQCCKHYEYLLSAGPGDPRHEARELFCTGTCPCCIGICVRKLCIKKGSKKGVPQPPKLSSEEDRLMAIHVVARVSDTVQKMLDASEKEAQRQNMQLGGVHLKNNDNFRILCNRCATTLDVLYAHCEPCDIDLCPACCSDIMGEKSGPVTCPVCKESKTTLHCQLTNVQIRQLRDAPKILEKVKAKGGPAVEAYDFERKLWRPLGAPLPPLAAAVSVPGAVAGPSGSTHGNAGPPANRKVVNQNQLVTAPANGGPLISFPAPAGVLANGAGLNGHAALQRASIQGHRNSFLDSAPLAELTTCRKSIAKHMELNMADSRNVVDAILDGLVRRKLDLGVVTDPALQLLAAKIEVLAAEQQRLDTEAMIEANNSILAVQQQQQQVEQQALGMHAVQYPQAQPGGSRQVSAAAPLPAPLVPMQDPSLATWHLNLPVEDYRKASNRADGIQNYIWTPHVCDFSPHSPRHLETMQRFVERWGAGEPIVVRGLRGMMNWGPDILTRAARDMMKGEIKIDVINCSDWNNFLSESTARFFNQYKQCYGPTNNAEGTPLAMLKLKDFPPDALFRERCQRHNDDFTEMLNSCMPLYLHPSAGVLNLAGILPQRYIPPDLGPKGYIAFGREEEHEGEGDSVTRLHLDLSDAINIVCHVQRPPGEDMNAVPPARCGDEEPQLPGYSGAGALWDLFRREDMATLRQFLLDAASDNGVEGCPPFYYKGQRLHVSNVIDVIHDQSFMLTAPHRAVLRDRYGIQPWTIEQYESEGVIIPSRCPHQVRNLRACIKIALDTVSPESVEHCMMLREDMRVLAQKERPEDQLKEENDVGERHFHDKLQVGNMAMYSLANALMVLSPGLGKRK